MVPEYFSREHEIRYEAIYSRERRTCVRRSAFALGAGKFLHASSQSVRFRTATAVRGVSEVQHDLTAATERYQGLQEDLFVQTVLAVNRPWQFALVCAAQHQRNVLFQFRRLVQPEVPVPRVHALVAKQPTVGFQTKNVRGGYPAAQPYVLVHVAVPGGQKPADLGTNEPDETAGLAVVREHHRLEYQVPAELVRRRRVQVECVALVARYVKLAPDERRDDPRKRPHHTWSVRSRVPFPVELQVEVQLARAVLRNNLVGVPLGRRLPRVVVPERLGMRDHEAPLPVALLVRERRATVRLGGRVVQRLLLPAEVLPA